MSLKFYYDPISQPSRAVLALLNIGKIKFEHKVLALFKGEHKQPEFTSLTPFGSLPCLQHGEFVLGESNAILTYLCEAFPSTLESYAGLGLQERALVSQYLSWYQGTFRPALVKIMGMKIQLGIFQGKSVPASEIKAAEAKMHSALDFLEKHFTKGGPYMVGDHMTIVDLLIFHEATNVEIYCLDLSKWKKVNEWYNLMITNEEIAKIYKVFQEGKGDFIGALSKVIVE